MFTKLYKLSFFVFIFVAAVTGSAYARFQGLYLGGNLGAVLLKGKHVYTNATPQQGSVELSNLSYIAGLQGGYMHYLADSKFVLGGELGFSITGLNATKTLRVEGGPVEGQVSIREPYKYSFAIFAGMALNPKVLVYAKLGIEKNKFTLKYSNLTFQTPGYQTYSVSLVGFAPGAGAYYKLSQNLLIGGEYNYSFIKKVQPRMDTSPVNGANRGYSISPIQHRLLVKIIRIF
ncbi:outer membrane protein [Candidatus Finniella inopinata]|uniref:Outer membrane protein beta-barrel domain-containing protein n=1 Tax=Candidatus Finniella inopinata TaxID=1696036 RepID=A0A4Q7DK38_9PROT|nr:outer membrane beta-barrel protein [Candidatus Finniella inopinata]RZI46659.1 hypothetical protein EQU50_03490 [Candidatus Finniella inopinata]